jgi:hypothetical protein
MKKLFLLIFLLVCFDSLLAQHTITLKPGDSLVEFKTKFMYRNRDFVLSEVIFNDGKITRAKLNYNQLTDRMDFINPRGDTLELTGNHLIKEVVINKSIFRQNNNGFFELIKDGPGIKLAKKTPVRQVNEKEVGGVGINSPTIAPKTYRNLQGVSGVLTLTPNVEQILSIDPVFYFGDANSNFLPATQKNLQKILPGKKDLIAGYMKNNQVNFSRIEDILSLLDALKAP